MPSPDPAAPLCRQHGNPCVQKQVKNENAPNYEKWFWCCGQDWGCGWNGLVNPQPGTIPQTPSRRDDLGPEPGSAATLVNPTPQTGLRKALVENASLSKLADTLERLVAENKNNDDDDVFSDPSALTVKLDFKGLTLQAHQNSTDSGTLVRLRGEVASRDAQISIWRDRDAQNIVELVQLKVEIVTVKAEFEKMKKENERVKAENEKMQLEIEMLRAGIEGE